MKHNSNAATQASGWGPRLHDWCAIAVGLVALGGLFVGVMKLITWFWGPYAMVFLDAGPLFLSRGGEAVLALALVFCVFWPLTSARGESNRDFALSWFIRQVVALALLAALALTFGSYVHSIVGIQGVETSKEVLAVEVGFPGGVAGIPVHVREAIELSGRLFSEDKAPWAPFAWQEITWPAIPQK